MDLVDAIRAVLAESGNRVEKAQRFAQAIRRLGDFRWVGIYDVGKSGSRFSPGVARASPPIPDFRSVRD